MRDGPEKGGETLEGEWRSLGREPADAPLAALIAVLCLLPGLAFLLSGSHPLGGFQPAMSENMNEWVIYRSFIRDCLAQGTMPAWCPKINCGQPLAGWPHAAIFAPLSAIYLLLDFANAAAVSMFLHFAVFCVSSYFLLRALSVRPWPSMVAAVLGMGPYILVEGDHFLPRLLTYAWSPLLFFCLAMFWRTGMGRYLLSACLLQGVQILSGHPETVGRQYLFLGLLFAGLLIFARRDLWARRKKVAAMFIVPLAGALLGAAQLIPTLEFVALGTRSDPARFTYEVFSQTAGAPLVGYYIRLILGPLLPGLLIVSLWRLRAAAAGKILLFLFATVLILSANFLGVQKLLYHVPVIGSMMWHQVNLHFLNIAAMAAAGMGIDAAIRKGRLKTDIMVVAAAGLAALAFIALEEFRLGRTIYVYPLEGAYAAQFRLLPLLALAPLSGAIIVIARRSNHKGVFTAWLAASSLATAYAPIFLYHHYNRGEFPSYNEAYESFFSGADIGGRVYTFAPSSFDEQRTVPYQAGLLPGERAIDSMTTSAVAWYGDFFEMLAAGGNAPPPKGAGGRGGRLNFWAAKNVNIANRADPKMLGLANVEYLAMEKENLKGASDYFPSYYLSPESCLGGECAAARLGEDGSPAPDPAGKGLLLSSPGGFRFKARPNPGSALAIANVFPGKGGAMITVTAGGSGRSLLYARHFDYGGHSLTRAVRAGLAGLSTSADITVAALDPISRPASAREVFVEGLRIINSEAVYERLGIGGVDIYRNAEALPRVFAVHRIKVIAEPGARLGYMFSGGFDPAREAVLLADPRAPVRAPPPGAAERLDVVQSRPGLVEIEADRASPGLALVSNVYYPGWRARSQRGPLRVIRADHAFMAVPLEQGKSSVSLEYRPASLKLGVWVAAASWLALLVFFSVFKKRGRGGQGAGTPPAPEGA